MSLNIKNYIIICALSLYSCKQQNINHESNINGVGSTIIRASPKPNPRLIQALDSYKLLARRFDDLRRQSMNLPKYEGYLVDTFIWSHIIPLNRQASQTANKDAQSHIYAEIDRIMSEMKAYKAKSLSSSMDDFQRHIEKTRKSASINKKNFQISDYYNQDADKKREIRSFLFNMKKYNSYNNTEAAIISCYKINDAMSEITDIYTLWDLNKIKRVLKNSDEFSAKIDEMLLDMDEYDSYARELIKANSQLKTKTKQIEIFLNISKKNKHRSLKKEILSALKNDDAVRKIVKNTDMPPIGTISYDVKLKELAGSDESFMRLKTEQFFNYLQDFVKTMPVEEANRVKSKLNPLIESYEKNPLIDYERYVSYLYIGTAFVSRSASEGGSTRVAVLREAIKDSSELAGVIKGSNPSMIYSELLTLLNLDTFSQKMFLNIINNKSHMVSPLPGGYFTIDEYNKLAHKSGIWPVGIVSQHKVKTDGTDMGIFDHFTHDIDHSVSEIIIHNTLLDLNIKPENLYELFSKELDIPSEEFRKFWFNRMGHEMNNEVSPLIQLAKIAKSKNYSNTNDPNEIVKYLIEYLIYKFPDASMNNLKISEDLIRKFGHGKYIDYDSLSTLEQEMYIEMIETGTKSLVDIMEKAHIYK